MNESKGGGGGKLFYLSLKKKFSLQIPRKFFDVRDKSAFLCRLRRGSLTLEAALVLPFFLCAVTALLYIFAYTSAQADSYRTLTERAQALAVTVGQAKESDPYIRLYDASVASLPFPEIFRLKRVSAQRAVVRAWVGYTGESFQQGASEEMVYVTEDGSVCHRSRDCTHLRLSVRMLAASSLQDERNQSGGKYKPCEYCVKKAATAGVVYITDYGDRYHTDRSCRGLKRTVIALPWSEAGGLPLCSRCGGS